MTLRSFRIHGLALAVAGMLAAAPAWSAVQVFDGGGYGPTPETAVQAAIWDAEASASAYGLFTCRLVGEPQVFPQPPGSLRAFTAQVRLRCR